MILLFTNFCLLFRTENIFILLEWNHVSVPILNYTVIIFWFFSDLMETGDIQENSIFFQKDLKLFSILYFPVSHSIGQKHLECLNITWKKIKRGENKSFLHVYTVLKPKQQIKQVNFRFHISYLSLRTLQEIFFTVQHSRGKMLPSNGNGNYLIWPAQKELERITIRS